MKIKELRGLQAVFSEQVRYIRVPTEWKTLASTSFSRCTASVQHREAGHRSIMSPNTVATVFVYTDVSGTLDDKFTVMHGMVAAMLRCHHHTMYIQLRLFPTIRPIYLHFPFITTEYPRTPMQLVSPYTARLGVYTIHRNIACLACSCLGFSCRYDGVLWSVGR